MANAKGNPNIAEVGKATRFPVNTKPHTGPYLVPLLRRLLEKKITFEDPETQKLIKGKVKDAVLWRLILNATQGETHAIKEILDRLEGKSLQKTELSGQLDTGTKIIVVYPPDYKAKEDRVGDKAKEVSSRLL